MSDGEGMPTEREWLEGVEEEIATPLAPRAEYHIPDMRKEVAALRLALEALCTAAENMPKRSDEYDRRAPFSHHRCPSDARRRVVNHQRFRALLGSIALAALVGWLVAILAAGAVAYWRAVP